MTQPPVPPNQPPGPPFQPGPQGQPPFPPGQPPFPPGQPPFSSGQPPYSPGPPQRARGPWLLVGGLVLLLVIVIAAGVVLLVTRSDGEPTAEQSTPAARTKPSDPAAVQFRRVLSAAPGSCPTPAPAGTACDDKGMQYKLGNVELDGSNVSEVKAGFEPATKGYWYIAVNLDPEGTKLFGRLTASLAKQGPPTNQVAILVRGQVVAAPIVQSEISGGEVQISGGYTRETAEDLVKKIVG